jgi:hypothetical protein
MGNVVNLGNCERKSWDHLRVLYDGSKRLIKFDEVTTVHVTMMYDLKDYKFGWTV